MELRTYVLIDTMQPQYAALTGVLMSGDVPVEGMAEVFRLVGEDTPDVRGAMVLGEMGLGKNRKKIVYEQPEPREVNALRHELGLFVSAVVNGTTPAVTADDARQALAVATSIMQKISQQQLPV